MKKVLLVVGYKTINYGSMLQAYATQKLFEKTGMPVEILNMEMLWISNRKKRVMFYLREAEIIDLINRKGGVYLSKIVEKVNKDYKFKLKQRQSKFSSYINRNLKLTVEVSDWNEASRLARDYDVVVIGSDQVWLPSSVVTDIYTLAFANDGQIKVAYAPSFGIGKIPEKYWGKYKEMLENFQFLSVREEGGMKIVKEIAGLDCRVVADPVYMLEKDEWIKEIPDKILFDERYIFVYLMGNNQWQRKMISQYANSRGIKTVALIHLDQYIGYDERYYDIKLVDVEPGDFLNLIRHSEMIFTDSFHCVSFSIIENKEFFVFKRYKDYIKGTTNSRMYSLFNMLHIDDNRIIIETSDIEEVNVRKLDYGEINRLLSEIRKSSWKFVQKALE